MSKEPILCGFCGRECKESEDIGFIRFPDDRMKAVHLSHTGVKEEWESQDRVRKILGDFNLERNHR